MTKICCFAGHRDTYCVDLEKRIKEKLMVLIEEGVKTFWVGHYGRFDKMAAQVVRELKQCYSDVNLVLVIPYLTKEINHERQYYYENYDAILLADIPFNTPKRFAIEKCNQYMVDNCQYLICYVCTSFGGAAKTLAYAEKKKDIQIVNLSK